MIKIYSTISGLIFLSAGLAGIFIGHLSTLAQFDLYQSFIYLILGFWGLSAGFMNSRLVQKYYIRTLAYTTMILLLLGLTLPNFLDIIHLELVEHLFHAVMFVTAVIVNTYLNRV